MNNACIEEIEANKYEIKEVVIPAPSKEEMERARAFAYAEEIDPLHARKINLAYLIDIIL